LQDRLQHSSTKKLELHPRPTGRTLKDAPITLQITRATENTLVIPATEQELIQDKGSPFNNVPTPRALLSLPLLDFSGTFTNDLQPISEFDRTSDLFSLPLSTTCPLFSSDEVNLTNNPSASNFSSLRPHEDLSLDVLDRDEAFPRSLDLLDPRDCSDVCPDWSSAQDIPLFSSTTPADIAAAVRPNYNDHHPNSQSQAMTSKNFDLENVIAAGLEVLLCGRRSATSQAISPLPQLPSPRMNCIQFHPNKIILACIQNALSMGFLAQDVIMPRCLAPSPFYRPIIPSDDPKQLLAAATRPSTPAHLRPMLPQLLYPHPAFMDLIPLPVFRARAITLAATQPHLFDMVELKKDMVVEDGLVLWSSGQCRRGEGKGQPWDGRSWEAAPWFLRKWRVLVDGEEGEVWKQSLWWQRARGDSGDGVASGI
jgi:hypothetical protein